MEAQLSGTLGMGHRLVILELGRLAKQDLELKSSLIYIVRLGFK